MNFQGCIFQWLRHKFFWPWRSRQKPMKFGRKQEWRGFLPEFFLEIPSLLIWWDKRCDSFASGWWCDSFAPHAAKWARRPVYIRVQWVCLRELCQKSNLLLRAAIAIEGVVLFRVLAIWYRISLTNVDIHNIYLFFATRVPSQSASRNSCRRIWYSLILDNSTNLFLRDFIFQKTL